MLSTILNWQWLKVFSPPAVLAALWGLHFWRMRRLERRFQLVLDERSRVSQELHDTMLQGFLGVAWQMEAASSQLPEHPAEAKGRIEELMERLDGVLREARQIIWDLQSRPLRDESLPGTLARLAESIFSGSPLAWEIENSGPLRPVVPEVAHSLAFLVREAWVNARRHSQATRIETELIFSTRDLTIRIRDNGVGMNVREETGQPGQWGIPNMRQRAMRIKADFQLESIPGGGTVVSFRLPSRVAYASSPRSRGRRRRR